MKKKSSNLRDEKTTLYVGFLSGFVLWFYSIFSAHANGRYLWVTYPYADTLSAFSLERFFQSHNKRRLSDGNHGS
jgi:Na+-driven multidrug efflux pump